MTLQLALMIRGPASVHFIIEHMAKAKCYSPRGPLGCRVVMRFTHHKMNEVWL